MDALLDRIPYRVWLLLAWIEFHLSPKLLWHRAFGHPVEQRVGPWCNCMGVYNTECAD